MIKDIKDFLYIMPSTILGVIGTTYFAAQYPYVAVMLSFIIYMLLINPRIAENKRLLDEWKDLKLPCKIARAVDKWSRGKFEAKKLWLVLSLIVAAKTLEMTHSYRDALTAGGLMLIFPAALVGYLTGCMLFARYRQGSKLLERLELYLNKPLY